MKTLKKQLQNNKTKKQNLESKVIVIKGIPGSGKSYICKLLPKHISCLDTDDFVTLAYDQLIKQKIKFNDNDVFNLAIKLCKNEISKHKLVVLCGMLFNIPNVNSKYFIKMDDKQLEISYKRVILREIEKYKHISRPSIVNHIKTLSGNEISYYLSFKHHLNAIEPSETTFDNYKKMYYNALNFEKKNGFLIMTQQEIVNDIIKNL